MIHVSDVADLPTSSLNLDDDGHKVHFPKSDLVGKRIVRSHRIRLWIRWAESGQV